VATTDMVGVEATLSHSRHIHRDPLTHLSNNNMEVMVDIVAMVVGLLQDSHHRIMVVMGLAVVVLCPEAVLLIITLRTDKVDTMGMEQPIPQVDIVEVIVVMVVMVLIMHMGIKAEVVEVPHTTPLLTTPPLEEEEGLGSYILTMLNFM